MSRTLKWVLAILAVLVVVAIAAGAVWAWQNRAQMLANNRPYAAQPGTSDNGQPYGFGQRGFNDDGRGPMMGPWGFRGPMMGGGMGRFGRVGPFGMGLFFIGGLFRLVIPLAVLAIVAFIFYQMGRRATRTIITNPPPPPVDAPKTE